MPQLRDVTVTLRPATIRPSGMVTTSYDLTGKEKAPTQQFQAATTDKIIAEAKRFAEEHGKPCAVSITLAEGQRKPAKFDAGCATLRYANLPKQTAEVK